PLSRRGALAALVALLLAFNVGLLVWTLDQRAAPEPVEAAAPYHFYIAVEELAGESVAIAHFSGLFDPANADAQRTVSALMSGFPAVQVLSLPALDASVAIASDT